MKHVSQTELGLRNHRAANAPKVSFVVPCYRLAHLLPECLASILSQTFADFEVVVMDDCSPDNTQEVVTSFGDERIRYVRNETNLGHLRNYNKGIRLTRGEYVWLISADDRLRKEYVLDRYVRLLDRNKDVAYVCCSGVEIDDAGRDIRVLSDYAQAEVDTIFAGQTFIPKILDSTGVLAASVCVRKTCYLGGGLYPLDLPHRADIYLWCMLAISNRVGFLAEPMIDYRRHAASMMQTFMRESPRVVINDEVTVLWRIKREAERHGLARLARQIENSLGCRYAFYVSCGLYRDRDGCLKLTLREAEESIEKWQENAREGEKIHAQFSAHLGDQYYWHENYAEASAAYKMALRLDPTMTKFWLKYFVLRLGGIGVRARCLLGAVRLGRP